MGKQRQSEQERNEGDGVTDREQTYDDLFEEVRSESAPNPAKVEGGQEHEWKEEPITNLSDVDEETLDRVLRESFEKGGKPNTMLFCGCGGLITGADYLCSKCGADNREAVSEMRAAIGGDVTVCVWHTGEPSVACGGPLAGDVAGRLWCTRCAKEHKA